MTAAGYAESGAISLMRCSLLINVTYSMLTWEAITYEMLTVGL